jgi:hypothetical protein
MSDAVAGSGAAPRAPFMQLLAQDYAEVLAALQALTDSKGHERRTTARMEVLAQVKIHPYRDGKTAEAYTCLTRDLSFKGVGLFQAKQAPRGSQFVVVLPRQENDPLTLLCTVMYTRPMADGLYNVGASFNSRYDFNAKPAVEIRGSAAAPAAPAKPAPAAAAPPGPPLSGEEELKRIRQSILD